jgi:hypothetical protein
MPLVVLIVLASTASFITALTVRAVEQCEARVILRFARIDDVPAVTCVRTSDALKALPN